MNLTPQEIIVAIILIAVVILFFGFIFKALLKVAIVIAICVVVFGVGFGWLPAQLEALREGTKTTFLVRIGAAQQFC